MRSLSTGAAPPIDEDDEDEGADEDSCSQQEKEGTSTTTPTPETDTEMNNEQVHMVRAHGKSVFFISFVFCFCRILP